MAMIFLELVVDGKRVDGDSTSRGFEGQIDIEGLDWEADVEEPGEDAESSGKSARAHMKAEHLGLSKYFDSASTRLYDIMNRRKRFDSARVTVSSMKIHESSQLDEKILVVELKEGYIESIDTRASGSGKSMSVSESLSLSYRECKIVYQPLNPETLRREGKTTEFRHRVEAVDT